MTRNGLRKMLVLGKLVKLRFVRKKLKIIFSFQSTKNNLLFQKPLFFQNLFSSSSTQPFIDFVPSFSFRLFAMISSALDCGPKEPEGVNVDHSLIALIVQPLDTLVFGFFLRWATRRRGAFATGSCQNCYSEIRILADLAKNRKRKTSVQCALELLSIDTGCFESWVQKIFARFGCNFIPVNEFRLDHPICSSFFSRSEIIFAHKRGIPKIGKPLRDPWNEHCSSRP